MMKKIAFIIVAMCLISNIAYAQGNYLHITADLSSNDLSIDSNYNITTEFHMENFVKQTGNQYIFRFSYKPEDDFDDFKLKIVLPENMIISEQNDILMLSRPAQISTDGRRIFIEWEKELRENEEITIFAEYETKGNINLDPSYFLFFFVLMGIAFGVGYGIKRFKREKFIERAISADEKIILNIIKKDKEIMQEELKEKTGWSKTKISKVIRRLEAKELIEKKPYRKTNKLSIKK